VGPLDLFLGAQALASRSSALGVARRLTNVGQGAHLTRLDDGERIPNPAPSEIGAVFLGELTTRFFGSLGGPEPVIDETSFTVVCRVDSITGCDVAIFDRLSVDFPFWAVPRAEWTGKTVDWISEV
jgi:hypothetical protein